MKRLALVLLAAASISCLLACSGTTTPPAVSTPAAAKPSPKATASEWPAGARIGDTEVLPILAEVRKVPLDFLGREGDSENEHLTFTFQVINHSENKRVDFRGWPEKDSFFVNYSATDEHGNEYKAVTFGIGSRPAGDAGGSAIDPGENASAILALETPIKVANSLTLTLKGNGVGLDGGKFEWTVKRSDWEKGQE